MTTIDLTKSTSVFSIKEKAIRITWNLCWSLATLLPRQLSDIRIVLLRIFGAKIGKKCLIDHGVKIWIPWNLNIENFVAIGRYVEIYNYGMVTIGTMTVISQYSYLCTGSHEYENPYMPLIWDKIIIGSECWIAAGTCILPGVIIGNGSVIGAKSLVTKNMPEWMVCAGHPCKPIKIRKLNKPLDSI